VTDEDRIALAGEYVLGTLDASERAAAQARLALDPAFVAEVRAWERRLAALGEGVAKVQPSAAVWPAIDRRTGGAVGGDTTPIANDTPGPWRFGAIAASLVAAFLAGWIALQPAPAPERVVVQVQAPRAEALTVALLTEGGTRPGLLLTVDEKSGAVIAQPVNLSTPSGRSLELWTIVGTAAPRKLGLIDPAKPGRYQLQTGEAQAGTKFAISIEPPGGAPGATPTGPITFIGEALRVPQPS